jgi:hypothetical protein
MTLPVVAEGSAGPVGLVIIVICLAAMLFTFRRALSSRRTSARVHSGPLSGGSPAARPPGSAAAITDGGQVPAQELLGALGVRPETDADADSDDEGTGAQLGLRYHRFRHSAGVWDPTVYDGTRHGHQVFIRLGRSASVRGPGLDARRLRSICAVRVAGPEFELVAADGQLRGTTALPSAITMMLAQLSPSPDVWHDLRVVVGPAGLVASRGVAQDWLGGWIYDLWLLERIAMRLGTGPLPSERLGRAWTPPYGMGDWAPSVRDTLSGT